jgi:hypothetical protein
MPLSQHDPDLDYDGSWGDASEGWPSIPFSTEEEAKRAYVVAGVKPRSRTAPTSSSEQSFDLKQSN